jgi:hypothetical protein
LAELFDAAISIIVGDAAGVQRGGDVFEIILVLLLADLAVVVGRGLQLDAVGLRGGFPPGVFLQRQQVPLHLFFELQLHVGPVLDEVTLGGGGRYLVDGEEEGGREVESVCVEGGEDVTDGPMRPRSRKVYPVVAA